MDILVVGSGYGIKEWYKNNLSKFVRFNEIRAINNAVRIFTTPVIHHVSGDFYVLNKELEEDCKKHITETVCLNTLKIPLYVRMSPAGDTMFSNICCHIFNTYGFNCRVHVIGCDFDYSGPATHFYGQGGLDPLREGQDKLVHNLKILNALGIFYNLSNNPNTLLPFKRSTILD